MIHPCQKCGACCAYFRVSFHWSETLPESFSVPLNMTEVITPHTIAMRGTNQPDPCCQALVGVIGQDIQCSIYTHRPEPCRTFRPSFEDGFKHDRCDQARSGKGMRALTLLDWL
jgi:uncharacterized protein